MKLHQIQEPFLEFGHGTDVCPRAGITKFEVYDTRHQIRRDRIFVGAVGTSKTLLELADWLEKCSASIAPKEGSSQPNLFAGFCGFNANSGFRARLIQNDEITRSVHNSEIQKLIGIADWNERVAEAVGLYYEQVKFLAQNRTVDVIVCTIPTDLYDKITKGKTEATDQIEEQSSDDVLEMDFRRALKAKAMHLGKPLQLIRELALEGTAKSLQDEATIAWNFCVALYYKANRTVTWKLKTNINRPSICFVGIGFYRSRDRQVLNTSLAQIFDELGNGVILRGTPVDLDKEDRRPFLTEQQAFELLTKALGEYSVALGNSPGRLVIHKSSKYRAEELTGFRAAAANMMVRATDFVTILDSDKRLFREGIYPPYRGTHIELEEKTHLLYTKGSVDYYKTYPGLYVPRPLEIRLVETDEAPGTICQEILGLTKMNWNNTQFDGKYPITIQCAKKVGEILKYVAGEEQPQISYGFYM